MSERQGVPFSVGEAKMAAERNRMDPYHRDLILFLAGEYEKLNAAVAAERQRCAEVVRSCNKAPFVVALWIDDPRELDYALNEVAEELLRPPPV